MAELSVSYLFTLESLLIHFSGCSLLVQKGWEDMQAKQRQLDEWRLSQPIDPEKVHTLSHACLEATLVRPSAPRASSKGFLSSPLLIYDSMLRAICRMSQFFFG